MNTPRSEGHYRALFSASVTLTLAILGRFVRRPLQPQQHPILTNRVRNTLAYCGCVVQLYAACTLCILKDWRAARGAGDAGGSRVQLPHLTTAPSSCWQDRP